MNKYDPVKTEAKWTKIWHQTNLNKTPEEVKDKFYNLVMFPYPSGNLHIGHWYNFAPADTLGRFSKMHGKDVLEPFGYDSFGLPAENAAIQRGLMADKWTDQNIADMTLQMNKIGAMYDWDKTLKTSDPNYYKWTQWMFLKLFQDKKAYQKDGLVNWCPNDKTVLANEQVVNGECDRCGTTVERKNLKQWYFKTTAFADALIDDLDSIDWPDKIKEMQRNWIGRSVGAHINFAIDGSNEKLQVYTTRPDTIYGVTFMVVAPEHPLVGEITSEDQSEEVNNYIAEVGAKTNIDRMETKEKTGVFTGAYAVNPATNQNVPIWISEYVLMEYGTGAIMSVPAHDERDYEFAKKFGLEITQVIEGGSIEGQAHVSSGKLINSGEFDGMDSDEAKQKITTWLESKNIGQKQTNYRLRDWLISRQRYWGTPIPIIHCDNCGVVAVPEKDLPVVLPLDQKFGKDGRSPLLDNEDFLNVKCPDCGDDAKRETDTMDTFVDSSWYFLRYPNPQYLDGPFDPVAVKRWLPVDRYIGGAEHAVLHLMYARFFTKFLHSKGHLDFNEPFTKLINQGMIDGPDGKKMSKSKGNVINPDDYVDKYGADSVRMYLMFMGPYEDGGPWDPKRFEGTHRFVNKIWDMITSSYSEINVDSAVETELESKLHKLIKKVTEDVPNVRFNTAIASMMEFVNYASSVKLKGEVSANQWNIVVNTFTKVLAPFAPFLSEELWEKLGNHESVHAQAWPIYDENLLKDDVLTIIIQINGKLRDEFLVNSEDAFYQDELERMAKEKLGDKLAGMEVIKTVVVPGKLVNFVVR
jgi:leucyl-tRNA synthetase